MNTSSNDSTPSESTNARSVAVDAKAGDVLSSQPKSDLGRVEGRVDSLTRWGATGWAWIPTAPDLPLQIEAVLNGKILGRDVADRLRPDLAEFGKRNGRCSFSLTFEEPIDADTLPILRAVGPNGATILSGGKWSNIAGYIDRLTPLRAIGWAWMPAEPELALQIEAVLDGKVVGRAIADRFRPDIASSGRGSGKYGFALDFDEPISDNKIPQLRVLGPGTPTILRNPARLESGIAAASHASIGVPITPPVAAASSGSVIHGLVEGVTRWGVTGWAYMPNAPEEPLKIEALLNGKVIGRAVANQMRPDLVKQGMGHSGFTLDFETALITDSVPMLRAIGSQGSKVLPGSEWLSVAERPREMIVPLDEFEDRTLANVSGEANGQTSLDLDVKTDKDSVARQKSFELDLISNSKLFNSQYYLAQYSDIAEAGVSPLEHFYEFGYLEGRRPNFYFDPKWYLDNNEDVRAAGIHPLVHYIASGDMEGRKPSLCFDPGWYRKQYDIPKGENALLHYLENRYSCEFSPIQDFDIKHYACSYPDVVAASVDPFEHYVTYGYREGRSPSPQFDANFYWTRYLGGDRSRNPYLHYLVHKHEPGVVGRMHEDEASIPREVKRYTRPAPEFEEFAPLPSSAPRRAKLLAYYLPQFHAFPENDGWWGKGFTEWTNLPRGLPRFKGHYQPRVPRDLGFYSLDHAESMRRQVQMAKAGGVFGFVFYYYWFNGKRLLEKPTEAFLADPSIDMPFCLMWANENWTRRWDGADAEVLISQDYRQEHEEDLVTNFARYFKDSRYFRIQGRPVLMIYRPGLIEDGRKTIARWRDLFQCKFGEDPLLVMGQAFMANAPSEFGMDGAIEFPPHKLTQDMPSVNSSLQYLDLEFEGKAYRYDDVVGVSLKEPTPAFPLIKTAVPSWDNDARRQGNGLVLIESTPKKYQAWLNALIERAIQNPFFGESIICVNAWNEWCEGAYLEPDLYYGAAYLNATARAVSGRSLENNDGRVLLVGHDCFPGGAQQLLLTIGRTLKNHFGVETSTVLLDGGKLEPAYRELGPLTICGVSQTLEAHFTALKETGYIAAIVNTSAAAAAVPALKRAGIEVTFLVHELPRILREKALTTNARIAAQQADRLVFPARFVMDQFYDALDLERDIPPLILPQGMYQKIEISQDLRDEQRRRFGVDEHQRLVIGMGYADMRKGFDIFLQVWRLVRNSGTLVVHFCWVGDIDPALSNMMREEIHDAERTGTFHMAGYRKDVSSLFSAADAFILSSREDPFPSVVLEALYAKLPVIAFERSGGIPDVLHNHPLGHVVPFANTPAMADQLLRVVREPPDGAAQAEGRRLIEEKFSFPGYVWQLLQLAHRNLPAISVAVPNYNYADHLTKRLASIFLQSQPVKEILVLDDCSTDNSIEVISAVAREWSRRVSLIPNKENSGSVFRQWRKAAETATSEFLWIAEADDLCAPQFLNKVITLMRHDPSVQFSFCDSSAIDADGKLLWPSYKSYYDTVEPAALGRTQIFEAKDFVERFLSIKNLILNVSAVVWRRNALLDAMKACDADLRNYKMAGDWRLYLQALSCAGAKVGYCAEPLNAHRRHAGSVTHALDTSRHVKEIAACHAFANSAFGIGSAVAQAQDKYRHEIAKLLEERGRSSN